MVVVVVVGRGSAYNRETRFVLSTITSNDDVLPVCLSDIA